MDNERILIIGMGEVGTAHAEILKRIYDVKAIDLDVSKVPDDMIVKDKEWIPSIIFIAIRYSIEFEKVVRAYVQRYPRSYVSILSTVPVGTTERLNPLFTHSTTRGLHPNLITGLRTITKHIGGLTSKKIADILSFAGINCIRHESSRTTEAAHILNNCAYGVNLMLADEMQTLCRQWGVDYTEVVIKYTETNNQGYTALDHKSKCRMVLTPPNGHIGGHCVVQSANLMELDEKTPMLKLLSDYNNK